MKSIFVISKRLLSITVLFFIVFFVLSSISSKPIHAFTSGYFYYECTNTSVNQCSSSKNISPGSVGLNVYVYVNGALTKNIGVSIKGSQYVGRVGFVNSFGHFSYSDTWGPSWNYWYTHDSALGCPYSSNCWTFVNGSIDYSPSSHTYPSPDSSPPGQASSNGQTTSSGGDYSASGTTNSNGDYYLSTSGNLDCGFSPFTLNISPPSGYTGISIKESNGQGLSSTSTSLGGLMFSNGTSYTFTVNISTNGSTPPPTSGCTITVSAKPSSVAKGSYTILTINETDNGSPVSGDTLKITSNDGTPTKTNPTTNSSGISNPTEYDPGSPPNTVIFTVASGKYSNCYGKVTVSWGGGNACTITVSAKPSSVAKGSYTIFTIHETYNGSNVSGDTLKITSNDGTPTKTNPTTNSLGISNPTEYDPGTAPNTVIFTVASGKYSNCYGKVTVSWGGGSSTCSISVSASPSNPT
ncbi:MAG: hypothetical protein ACYDBX_00525, partial [Patescibacteria group bacterium]